MTDKEQAEEAWRARANDFVSNSGVYLLGQSELKAALKVEIEKRMSLEIGPWKYCYEEVLSLLDTTLPL